ncbi:CD3337/EF1877 family mobilome membrane protein [Ectobacillus panaciterrae]|uniref:CD3337/EF1877 family mobilome membrane protein n=1 Tax=Ectobacillus panaciterrae TaxID=363872 RepID=UPI0003F9C0C8|nr:hypothetical protein [Ectobacillus panaciterrae]
MIKRVLTMLMVLFLGLVLVVPVSKTYAETPQVTNQVNNQDNKKEEDKAGRVKENIVYEGRIIKEQERFPVGHYALETYFPQDFSSFITLGYSQSGQQMSKSFADMIWFANKSMAQFFIYAVGEMMSYDFISKVSEPVGLTLEKISGVNTENGVFSSFLTIIVTIMMGSLVIMYYAQNNASGAVRALISSILILVGCYWFYGDASKHLKSINVISAEIENTISGWTVNFSSEADKTGDKPYTSNESKALLENQLFNLMIKRPYLNMMYGTSDEAKITEGKGNTDRITKLLELNIWDVASEQERNTIAQDEVRNKQNSNMSVFTLPYRVGYTMLYFIATLFLGIPFMMLAAAKIVLQIIFIVMLLVSPALFLFSLIPNFQDTAGHTVKKLIGLIVAKAGIVFLVTISIGVTTLLYETTQVADGFSGHAFLVFMDCLILFSIFKYRKEMFTIVSSARIHAEAATDRITHVTSRKVEQTKDLSKKGIGYAVKRVKQSNARGQNQETKATQPQSVASKTTTSSHNAKSSDKRALGTTGGSAVASTAPAKQSSARNQNENEHSSKQEETKPQIFIPIPQKKEETKQQSYVPIPQSQYRESPAREKRQVQGRQESQSREVKNNTKENDKK